jgi:hypothetical protein
MVTFVLCAIVPDKKQRDITKTEAEHVVKMQKRLVSGNKKNHALRCKLVGSSSKRQNEPCLNNFLPTDSVLEAAAGRPAWNYMK